MGNRSKFTDTRKLGLVEVEVDDRTGQVVLTLHPPGKDSASVFMKPADGYGLGKGIVDAAYQAESHAAPPPACPLCGGSLKVEGVPDV